MERNFKVQTFRKQANPGVKALSLKLPTGPFSLFPAFRYGRAANQSKKRLQISTDLDECIKFLVELAKIVVEFFVFIKNLIISFFKKVKNSMKKGSVLIILPALWIGFNANAQQVSGTQGNLNLSESGLLTGVESKNRVADDTSPVQLASFAAQSTGKAIVLSWSTISEQNNVGFELERMEEGENQFRTIDFVEGNGTSIQTVSYQYIDAFAGNAYYRLKQLNISGTYEYSKAIYVEASHIEKVLSPLSASTVLVYPYPASSFVNIELKTDDPTSFNVHVMDMMGKEFYCPVISKNYSGNKLTLGMDGLSKGMYLLVIQNGTTSVSKKIFLETN